MSSLTFRKTRSLTLPLLIALTLGAPLATAAPWMGGPGASGGCPSGGPYGGSYGGGGPRGMGGGQHPDAQLARMTAHLGLDAAQQEQIRALLEQRQVEQQRLRTETRAQIQSLLTEQQRALMADRGELRIAHRLQRLVAWLGLDAAQAAEVRDLLAARENDPGMTPLELRDRIGALLNPEQLALWESAGPRAERGWGQGWGRGWRQGAGPGFGG